LESQIIYKSLWAITPKCINMMPEEISVPGRESEGSSICVLGVSIFPLSTIYWLGFITIQKMCNFMLFILIMYVLPHIDTLPAPIWYVLKKDQTFHPLDRSAKIDTPNTHILDPSLSRPGTDISFKLFILVIIKMNHVFVNVRWWLRDRSYCCGVCCNKNVNI
jgi:hypothetical protein